MPSFLFWGSEIINSFEGVQQGDPVGPLLFCLTVHTLLTSCRTEFKVGYLDDLTLGDDMVLLAKEILRLEQGATSLGLSLNVSKCEIIANQSLTGFPTALAGFKRVEADSVMLLGSPLSQKDALDDALMARVQCLELASARLRLLHSHDALLILKNLLSIPALLHIIRSSPCSGHPSLQAFDDILRDYLSSVLNVDLNDGQWLQAVLPVRDGGLGIRSSMQLTPSAFLASATASAPLISAILGATDNLASDISLSPAAGDWQLLSGVDPCLVPLPASQRSWDSFVVSRSKDTLVGSLTDDLSQARLKAVMSPHSSDWLHAFPISSVGLRLSNEEIRVSAGLRLGTMLCTPHVCACNAPVNALGSSWLVLPAECRQAAAAPSPK